MVSAYRKAIESLYKATATITGMVDVLNNDHSTSQNERVLYEDVPCKLSHGSHNVVSDGGIPTTEASIKLFIAPELDIPSGCTIKVTQNGYTETYQQSGEPKHYTYHQEIELKLKREEA